MIKIFFSLIFLTLTSFSFGTPISGTGKIDFDLYGCCSIDKKLGKVCTTCEDTYIILDSPITYNEKTYTKLKIENSNFKSEIYRLFGEKIKIKGTIMSLW